jgi:hypothetical protein
MEIYVNFVSVAAETFLAARYPATDARSSLKASPRESVYRGDV